MKTYKILVIDDAFFIRNLIKKAIGRKPVKNDVSFEIVGEAENGSDGLRMCEELKPDIITVDFNIPELNGLDFAKYLKQTNPKIPILMISSNDNPSFPSEVEAIGCHFLPKPFQESFLWIRLDGLAEEIENFDDSQLPETAEEESLDLMKEISMEVEAEMEEIPIELEESIQLPKSQAEVQKEKEQEENTENSAPKKKRKRKRKKKPSNNLFGLEIDDSIVVKPKTEETKIESKEVQPEAIKTSPKENISVESKPIQQVVLSVKDEEKIEVKHQSSSQTPIILNTDKEEQNNTSDKIIFEDESITADIDGETIVIDEDDAPIIIDDGDDEIFIIDSDTEEEIMIEGDDDTNSEIIYEDSDEKDDDIIIEEDEPEEQIVDDIPDDFDLDSLEDMFISSEDIQIEEKPKKIGLNIKKEVPVIQEEELSEKDKIIKALKENANYSYQNEMSYVLHIMEKLSKQEAPQTLPFDDNEPIIEEEKAINRLMAKTEVHQSEDFLKEKEEEDAEFDALFAEFNPNIDLSEANKDEEKMESIHNESKKKLLKDAPSITQNVTIEPPKSERIRRMYQKDDVDENQLIVPVDDISEKESIFTKIFNLFSKK